MSWAAASPLCTDPRRATGAAGDRLPAPTSHTCCQPSGQQPRRCSRNGVGAPQVSSSFLETSVSKLISPWNCCVLWAKMLPLGICLFCLFCLEKTHLKST